MKKFYLRILLVCLSFNVLLLFNAHAQEAKKTPVENTKVVSQSEEFEGVTLVATFEKTIYNAIEPVILEIKIKNQSKSTIHIARDKRFHSLNFSVINPDSKISPLTLFGVRTTPIDIPKDYVLAIAPHEEFKQIVILNRDFDMTLLGKYKVTATIKKFSSYHKNGEGQTIEVKDIPIEISPNFVLPEFK